MNAHGRLTIEAGNAEIAGEYTAHHADVRPGQYVMLAVSDTGCGMTPEIMAQVFEPFFTTKPEGRGTGLGLSMVYGFVKQSNGHIMLYSEPGQGSTIRIYLPRVRDAEDVVVEVDAGPVTGGNETVLVVENDEEVRSTAVDLLNDLGYRVLKARDAQSALAIVDSGLSIDLLFSDVVMPGPLRSTELARLARLRQPQVAVLFTSGYTDNAIVHGGRLDQGTELLSKPYSREALARKIRHVLCNRRQRASAPPTRQQPSTLRQGTGTGCSLNLPLVEDDELIRLSTADMMTGLGHVVSEAAEAGAALTILKKGAIDVLVTDLGLPGMSGSRLAAEALRLNPGLKVIFATGADDGARKDREPAADAAIMLRKPYDILALDAALRAAGERRGSLK